MNEYPKASKETLAALEITEGLQDQIRKITNIALADIGLHIAKPDMGQIKQAAKDARTYGNGWLRVDAQGKVQRISPNYVLKCPDSKDGQE